MNEVVLKKKYIRIRFRLRSSLSIGSGENDLSDHDLMRDAKGRPYIPASAIAGVTRDILAANLSSESDNSKFEDYFGIVRTDGSEDTAKESRLIFYDATLDVQDDSSYFSTVRDSVALDEFKTAKKGAKFDLEVLEPGVQFTTYVEQSFYTEGDTDYTDGIADAFCGGHVRFGSKTTRGYGEIEKVEVKQRTFDFSKGEQEEWLDFDLFQDTGWKEATNTETTPFKKQQVLRLDLKQASGISVRRYTTKVSDGERFMPDSEQMTVHVVNGGSLNNETENAAVMEVPVIPGTTWTGAFRHRMKEFGVNVDEVFGYVKVKKTGDKSENDLGDDEGEKVRSLISFSESRIEGAKSKVLSRNAIDRFSGGTKDGALFTEKTWYGGRTALLISWRGRGMKMPDDVKKGLAATITDLHFGFLAIGGETSIGRGLFSLTNYPIVGSNATMQSAEDSSSVTESESGATDGVHDDPAVVYKKILRCVEEVFS